MARGVTVRQIQRPDLRLVAGLAPFPTSVIGDGLGRRCSLGPRIMGLSSSVRFVGPALTIGCEPGDNLPALAALEIVRPGDVLAISCRGGMDAAVLGANFARVALARGAVALVTDGLVRDVTELSELGIPVFATGRSPNGPFKTGIGEVGGMILLEGVPISPGDILVGDHDGVITIPAARLEEAVKRAGEVAERERLMARPNPENHIPDWLRELLSGADIRTLGPEAEPE